VFNPEKNSAREKIKKNVVMVPKESRISPRGGPRWKNGRGLKEACEESKIQRGGREEVVGKSPEKKMGNTKGGNKIFGAYAFALEVSDGRVVYRIRGSKEGEQPGQALNQFEKGAIIGSRRAVDEVRTGRCGRRCERNRRISIKEKSAQRRTPFLGELTPQKEPEARGRRIPRFRVIPGCVGKQRNKGFRRGGNPVIMGDIRALDQNAQLNLGNRRNNRR